MKLFEIVLGCSSQGTSQVVAHHSHRVTIRDPWINDSPDELLAATKEFAAALVGKLVINICFTRT